MIWGYEDESTVVQTPAGARVTMTYDGTHMRRQREEGASTAKYLWDGAQILMETDGSGTTAARYTLAPFGYGDLLSQRRSNASSFYHFDAIGSTRALSDDGESLTDTYAFEAWGSPCATMGDTPNPYRYVGRLGYYDEPSVDGCLLGRRYYGATAGRFLSVDPLPRSPARYAYAQDRPLQLTDPEGLWGCNEAQCRRTAKTRTVGPKTYPLVFMGWCPSSFLAGARPVWGELHYKVTVTYGYKEKRGCVLQPGFCNWLTRHYKCEVIGYEPGEVTREYDFELCLLKWTPGAPPPPYENWKRRCLRNCLTGCTISGIVWCTLFCHFTVPYGAWGCDVVCHFIAEMACEDFCHDMCA